MNRDPQGNILLTLWEHGTPVYGLEIEKLNPRIKRGSVYAALRRLLIKGLITEESKLAEGGRRRKYITLTAKGISFANLTDRHRKEAALFEKYYVGDSSKS